MRQKALRAGCTRRTEEGSKAAVRRRSKILKLTEGGEGHEELKSAWDFVRCDQKVRGAGMIAIIDYDAGNLRSVEKALIRIGGEPVITRDPGVIIGADHVILPGVGSFGDANL